MERVPVQSRLLDMPLRLLPVKDQKLSPFVEATRQEAQGRTVLAFSQYIRAQDHWTNHTSSQLDTLKQDRAAVDQLQARLDATIASLELAVPARPAEAEPLAEVASALLQPLEGQRARHPPPQRPAGDVPLPREDVGCLESHHARRVHLDEHPHAHRAALYAE